MQANFTRSLIGGILEGDELAAARQRDRIIELSRPTLANDASSHLADGSFLRALSRDAILGSGLMTPPV
jgi:hypothetical protein